MSLVSSRTALSVAVAVSCSLSFPLILSAPALGATPAAAQGSVGGTRPRAAQTRDQ